MVVIVRIVLIIHSLRAGGAERVLATLANHWAGQRHRVTIVTLEGRSGSDFYPLAPSIRRVGLDLGGESSGIASGISNNVTRVVRLRGVISGQKADVIISFMTETNVLSLLATAGKRLPVIIAEHTDPWTGPLRRPWRILRRRLYRRAQALVVLNDRARQYFHDWGLRRIVVVPNPVAVGDPDEAPDMVVDLPEGRLIVAAGRLSQEKSFDLLLRAFQQLASRHGEWSLLILGDGPERCALEHMVESLGLSGRVFLPGMTATPHAFFRRADMFVSSSVLEGFPMAICEAMACGTAVVAAEYDDSIHEIIEDGVNGMVVPAGDISSLAGAMTRLIEEPELRIRYAEQARKITERFGIDRIARQWEQILLPGHGT